MISAAQSNAYEKNSKWINFFDQFYHIAANREFPDENFALFHRSLEELLFESNFDKMFPNYSTNYAHKFHIQIGIEKSDRGKMC